MKERERKLEERQRSATSRPGLEWSVSLKERERNEEITRKRGSERSEKGKEEFLRHKNGRRKERMMSGSSTESRHP